MTDPSDSSTPLTVLPDEPRSKGHWIFAWLVIASLVAFIMWLQNAVLPNLRPIPAAQQAAGKETLSLARFQMRYFVGAESLTPDKHSLVAMAKALDTGPIEQRLDHVILIGELGGPRAAIKKLDELQARIKENDVKPTETEAQLMGILRRLYGDYAWEQFNAPTVTRNERAKLVEELSWAGELALHADGTIDKQARQAVLDSGRKLVVSVVVTFVLGLVLGFVGVIGLIIFLILLFTGRLQRGLLCGAERRPRCVLDLTYVDRFGRPRSQRLAIKRLSAEVDHGGVYAETFALWLVLFLCLEALGFLIAPKGFELLVTGILFMCSLVALGWPVLRGIPWSEVRAEIGLVAGKAPFLEPLLALANYVMMLPLIGLAILLIFLIVIISQGLHGGGDPADSFSPQHLPTHPIVHQLAGGNWWGLLQAFLVACVVAPIVEETMFRGVLYRHLRELTCRFGFFLSMALSSLVAGFVFAAIHPQGPIAIPALMAIAFGLTMVREWRGTLIPGMVTHGLHNGLLLMLVVLLFGA